jgi:diaminopimelate decarboxylase
MEVHHGKLYLRDLAATEIAARYGTPLYVMEIDRVKTQYRQFLDGISYRPLVVLYACKANANVQLMRALREMGAWLDACSPGDLAFGAAAGFTPDQISYTGSSVSDDELRLVVDRRVSFNADSLSQLDRYGRLAPSQAVGLRVNCGVVAGFHSHVQSAGSQSKFGIHPGQLQEALVVARRHDLRVTGIHTHVGSDIFDVDTPIRALDVLIRLSYSLSDLEFVDVGGGWGVPFITGDPSFDMASYGKAVSMRMGDLSAARGRPITFRIEPGAYLVSDAGTLLTRVTDLKPPVTVNEALTPYFVGTDTSYNHVFSAAMYDSYHEIVVADKADAPTVQTYHIVGNLMQAGDILAKDRPLPVLELGDLLVIKNCGAYSACRAPTFNERPRPAEVMVDGREAYLIRRQETVEDMLAHQVLDRLPLAAVDRTGWGVNASDLPFPHPPPTECI